jgi:dCMP deaminase
MKNYAETLLSIKRGFLILGLTGYTASGCTTAAKILKNNPLRYRKLKKEWDNLTWNNCVSIDISKIIFLIAISRALRTKFTKGILSQLKKIAIPDKNKLQHIKLLTEKRINLHKNDNAFKIIEAYQLAGKLYQIFKKTATNSLEEFIVLMQDFGDDVRKYGTVLPPPQTTHSPSNILILPEAIRRLIKSYRINQNASYFVIDAFRNPFEVEFFKRRYNEFYLITVQRDSNYINSALQGQSTQFIEKLNEREQGKLIKKKTSENVHEWITSQNIDECRQKADIFIENIQASSLQPANLRIQLIKLIALAQKPGCITPDKDERAMQLAISARQNSGCLSRHVGAVVTNKEGFVLGVGWNDPPVGQTPCSLRTAHELITEEYLDNFSEFERSNEFREHIEKQGIDDNPFCFKDELRKLKAGKWTEFTRALHAEENAMLQATCHGVESLRDSILYTTDSTCTLCAKKAYHLGISRIIYIEKYSGIDISQTLKTGIRKISVERFQGITGSAYFRLFTPLVPEKDFMKLYS